MRQKWAELTRLCEQDGDINYNPATLQSCDRIDYDEYPHLQMEAVPPLDPPKRIQKLNENRCFGFELPPFSFDYET